MTGRRVATTAALLLILLAARPARAALTEGKRLAAVYDLVLDAQFDQVDAQLARICPPAPIEACQSMKVASLWWQILINPESRALDKAFNDAAASAIAASEAWTEREPKRGEAWFYLAASHAPLMQWRVLRGERLAAARDANKIREALEHALQLDPTLGDAYFGIGLYHYYAAIAPAAAKILRWLLLFPGGDRAQGLQEIERARERGEILKGEVDYQLSVIDLWYERKTREAIDLLSGLDARYPGNPHFHQRLAEIRDVYLHDPAASAATWRELLDRALAGRVYAPRTTEVRARLGLATELLAMNRVDEAIEQLKIVASEHPAEPIGAAAQADAQLRAAIARRAK